MEWVLIIFTTAYLNATSFSVDGYKSETNCTVAAANIIAKLSVHDLKNGSVSGKMRKWEYVCAPSGVK
jgi:hypothetical protein